jgi:signal transduction histidine kinase
MAHELNNPASAARRGVDQLAGAVSHWQAALLDIARENLPPAQVEALQILDLQAKERGARPAQMDPLTRSERELEVEGWLEDQHIQNPWEISPTLVCLGCAPRDLDGLVVAFPAGQLPAVFSWLNAAYTIYSLLSELGQGARRISNIVEALKSYSYMDQAPVVSVDVNESLESTLALLAGRLEEGTIVHREYAPDLPHIQGYGSELTQVWTHLLDNALDAIAGGGKIFVRSRWEAPWVVVEVEDSGPGIPEAIHSKIFDPFFTTKPPGLGAGLGLSVSHNIIVQKHSGRLSFQSQPGKTVFDVRLPVEGPG